MQAELEAVIAAPTTSAAADIRTAIMEQWSKIKFGQLRTCTVCGWHEYDDWCAARASSVYKMLPPADPAE